MMAAALCALVMTVNAYAAIKEEQVTYQDGQTTMKGFVVYDDAVQGKRPGIIMVHEWWGITKHMHTEAQKFAQQGYTAFIADMYGDGKTGDNPKDAGALSGSAMKTRR
jgi:dienelactone hydrolase